MSKIEREALLEALRELGDPPDNPPTRQQMRDEGPYSEWPYRDRWGGWTPALEEAGYDTVDKGGPPTTPDEELIFDLQLGAVALGHSPSYTEYDTFGNWSASTLSKRFGGWPKALEEAELPPAGETVSLGLDDVDMPEAREE